MKKLWIAFCMVLFLSGAALADMTGVEAPDFSLKDLDGNPVSLARLSGKVVMLVHFNTYCHSCREEVPKINSIVQKYKNLRVIGIAIANDAEEVAEFKKNFKPDYDAGAGPAEGNIHKVRCAHGAPHRYHRPDRNHTVPGGIAH